MNHNPNKTSWRTANFAGKANISPSCPVPSAACARMMCSFLFAAFVFCLQRSFFVCSIRFLFAAFLLFAILVFLFAAYFFICSVSFLFAALLFCLQRFFFVCSVSFLFAACPLWAIVHFRVLTFLETGPEFGRESEASCEVRLAGAKIKRDR